MTIRVGDLDKTLTVREVLAALDAAGGYEKFELETWDHDINLGDFGDRTLNCDLLDEVDLPQTNFTLEIFEAELQTALDSAN